MKQLIFVFVFTLMGIVSPYTAHSQEIASFEDKVAELSTLISEANRLYEQKIPDISLAATVMERVAEARENEYYSTAQQFYMWSLLNSTFDRHKEEIEAELERTLPLVEMTVQKHWKELLIQKDPLLMKRLVGFWELNDPYATTEVNERLMEHWARIAYAKKHFTKADNSPYGTDDRGTFYVRLGPPDKKQIRTISVRDVSDPRWGGTFEFITSNSLRSKFELWEYQLYNGKKPYFIFAEKDGQGRFGLRTSAFELINMERVLISDDKSYNPKPDGENKGQSKGSATAAYMPNPISRTAPSIRRNYFKGLAQYALLSELSLYHEYFNNMFSDVTRRIQNRGSLTNSNATSFIRYFSNEQNRIAEAEAMKTGQQLRDAPDKRTELLSDEESFVVQNRVYRFLSEGGNTQYVVALKPNPKTGINNNYEYYQFNKLYIYDENRIPVHSMEDAGTFADSSNTSLYVLNEQAGNYRIYYSSELINSSFESAYNLDKFTQMGARVEFASGKKPLALPAELPSNQTILVSDIVLARNLNNDSNSCIPVTPTLDDTFNTGEQLTLYFEVYNVPKGGYSFEYHFEQDRKLFERRNEDQRSITIRNDKAIGKDTQLFGINLEEMPEGTYNLLLNFSALNKEANSRTIQKRIRLHIAEDETTIGKSEAWK